MKRARLLTPWTGTGKPGDENRPAVADAFAFDSWSDVTAQPADAAGKVRTVPNLYVIEAVMQDLVLAALQAHPLWAKAVLWAEDAGGGAKPVPVAKAADITAINDCLAANGVPADRLVAAGKAGADLKAVARDLIQYLQPLPKG